MKWTSADVFEARYKEGRSGLMSRTKKDLEEMYRAISMIDRTFKSKQEVVDGIVEACNMVRRSFKLNVGKKLSRLYLMYQRYENKKPKD